MTPGADCARFLARCQDVAPGGRIVACLRSGPVNESWLVETDRGCLVLRRDGPAAGTLGLNREREAQARAAAAEEGLAAPFLARDGAAGLALLPYVEGRVLPVEELTTPARLEDLGRLLARVHRVPWDGPTLDLAATVARYAGEAGARAEAQAREALARLEAAEAACPGPRVLCHNDPVAGNLVEEPGGILQLIDWEYSAANNPWFDLGVVAGHHGLGADQRRALLRGYGPGALDPGRLEAWVGFYEGLAGLWQQALPAPRI